MSERGHLSARPPAAGAAPRSPAPVGLQKLELGSRRDRCPRLVQGITLENRVRSARSLIFDQAIYRRQRNFARRSTIELRQFLNTEPFYRLHARRDSPGSTQQAWPGASRAPMLTTTPMPLQYPRRIR